MPAADMRRERIVVETDRYRVEGDITLPLEGYRSRLSDYLNRRDQEFLILLNVELNALDGSGRDWSTQVLMLARQHIRLVVPFGKSSDTIEQENK
ncbi:MAG TPA: hypothetical protein PLV50_01820 [Smithella sp.]|nr:hypothetical protein [Smithella sp.]MDM7988835.1 hypothetical protein [Smithella sp.]HNY49708.1 hypothetical protein [Smithella sp.]HOG89246.1 hypothetical protein [Smithella sp.]HOU51274.1 hypothetical protein [Smithella sp.]